MKVRNTKTQELTEVKVNKEALDKLEKQELEIMEIITQSMNINTIKQLSPRNIQIIK